MKKKEKKEPVSKAQLLQDFLNSNGITLKAYPQFVQRDDGTFSVTVRISVQ